MTDDDEIGMGVLHDSRDEHMMGVLTAHSAITSEYGSQLISRARDIQRAEETQQWLMERHVKYVTAVGLAATIKGDMELDVERPVEMMYEVVAYHANVQAYARTAYEVLAQAEHVLQHVGVFLAEAVEGTEEAALAGAAREAQVQCIEILQAAETF